MFFWWRRRLPPAYRLFSRSRTRHCRATRSNRRQRPFPAPRSHRIFSTSITRRHLPYRRVRCRPAAAGVAIGIGRCRRIQIRPGVRRRSLDRTPAGSESARNKGPLTSPQLPSVTKLALPTGLAGANPTTISPRYLVTAGETRVARPPRASPGIVIPPAVALSRLAGVLRCPCLHHVPHTWR